MPLTEYLGLIRFSHTLFALPFAILGGMMAIALNLEAEPAIWPRWVDMLGVLLCMVFARSAAMSFNRLADREFDARNPRTVARHLPSGQLSVRSVVLFTCACSIGFVGSTLLFLPNRIPICTAIPVLLFLFGYSYAKRFTVLVHLWLGAALGLSPIAAWVVFRPVVWPAESIYPPILLGLAVMFWTAGFDVVYSCQDAEIDKKEGLFSLPGRFGMMGALPYAQLFHFLMVVALLLIPSCFEPFGRIWYSGGVVTAVILLAEHMAVNPTRVPSNALTEADEAIENTIENTAENTVFEGGIAYFKPDVDRVNIAFFHMNWVISLGLLVVGIVDLCC